MNNGKLYVKGNCSICRGKKIGCHYCDSEGLTYVEAADTIISEWLRNLPEERRNKIIAVVKNEN